VSTPLERWVESAANLTAPKKLSGAMLWGRGRRIQDQLVAKAILVPHKGLSTVSCTEHRATSPRLTVTFI